MKKYIKEQELRLALKSDHQKFKELIKFMAQKTAMAFKFKSEKMKKILVDAGIQKAMDGTDGYEGKSNAYSYFNDLFKKGMMEKFKTIKS